MIKATAQQIARQVAKTTLDESNEFLKTAREQIAPFLKPTPEKEKPAPKNDEVVKEENKARSNRIVEAYSVELNQIRRDNLFKELQRKISEGEDVPVENYVNELSSEQREVLKAQLEAMKLRKEVSVSQKDTIPQIVSKKGRQMLNKIKKRNEQFVETRQPPSS